jgi:hypothetical protein
VIDVHDIVSHVETGLPYFNWREIFSLGPPKQMQAETILQKGWTLFGFDIENAVAIFLDVGAECDLSRAPFCYDAQVSQARRITTIGFEQFALLARGIKTEHQLVHVYNMGHCGSTLLHNVFNTVPGVWCLSEPKVFFDLALWRHDIDQALILPLAEAALKFISLFPAASQAQVVVLKHFSQANAFLPMMWDAERRAINLFLYRDGKSWSNSIYGFVQRMAHIKMAIPPERRSLQWRLMSGNALVCELDGLVDMNAETVTFDDLAAVAWALHIRDYMKAHDAGMPFFAVRYNELSQHRVPVIGQILKWCGLDPGLAEATLSAFDTDSHQGTKTARDIPVEKFGEKHYRQVAEILANPRINLDPDLRLPNSERGSSGMQKSETGFLR